MMLFKLSLKNIKKSFKDYAIYFFTLILGVSIFYIFNAIDSQTAMLSVSESTHELMKLMTQMLSGVSVFVSFILGFLIIYASRFLIKRRKKEFGVYMTLGMSKGKISKILFFETLLIGVVSLIVGLGIGIALSQIMSIVVANMFEADMDKFTFVFSSAAMIKTILYFGIMYLMVMIFNTLSIGKCKLIDLLNGSKHSEKVKLKNPFICIAIFVIAVVMLGFAYYNVTLGVTNIAEFTDVIWQMLIGAFATFLIFWSLSGLLLKLCMSIKKVYYKNLNMFTLRQINSKINTTVFSMTVICLMLFLTICILSSALSLKNSTTANIKKLAPADFQVAKKYDLKPDEVVGDYIEAKIADSKISIEETYQNMNVDYDRYFQDAVSFYYYHSPNITLRSSLGSYIDEALKQFKYLRVDTEEDIVKISDYNRLAKLYGMPTYSLEENEYMVIADFNNMVELRDAGLKTQPTLTLNGKTYTLKYDTCQDGFVEMSSNHINSGVILVPDHAVHDNMRYRQFFVANYKANDIAAKKKLEQELLAYDYSKTTLSGSSKLLIYEASVGLGALVTFIGIYLGIIFLISSAAILALKELSESSDNREKYIALRKLGVDETMLNHALFHQIAIFFGLPLLLAIIHSIFGIQTADYILSTIGNEKLLSSIIMTAIFLGLIYGGYFLITYFCSKNIISEKE